jgi:hypothetical protein
MWHCRRFVLVYGASTLCAVGVPLTPIGAETCAPSQDRVTLTITGATGKTNVPGRADFDLAGLERLGVGRLTTWILRTNGGIEFDGVWALLMEAVGARGTEARARALNDYEEAIPLEEFHSYEVLLALRMEGQLMRVRNKGPI